MAIDGSGGLGFNNPQLDTWLRERTAQRLQTVIDERFRRVESERLMERYRAVAIDRLASALTKTLWRSY